MQIFSYEHCQKQWHTQDISSNDQNIHEDGMWLSEWLD